MSTIVSVATAVPSFSASQTEVKEAFRPLIPLDGRRLDAAMALFDHAEVGRRHSVLALSEIGRPRALRETMLLYAQNARELGRRVARQCLRQAAIAASDIDLIITVSCTGVMIPSLDAWLIDELGFRRDVRRLPITELGCFGGAAALAHAHDYLRGHPASRVLVIAVELPSLSLQSADVSPDSIVSSAIFGDGAAAVVLAGEDTASLQAGVPTTGVRVVATLSHTIPASTHALGFDLHDDGFHAVLSKEVPALLRAVVADLVTRLATSAGLTPEDLTSFIIHAGGKKILGSVEEALGLRREQTKPSWDVLRDYGNQSSASVLFVLERWQCDRRPESGSYGVMAAFGPGLTAESLLVQWT